MTVTLTNDFATRLPLLCRQRPTPTSRVCDRLWDLDRHFVSTNRLTSRLVLPLVYTCWILYICIFIYLYMYNVIYLYHWYICIWCYLLFVGCYILVYLHICIWWYVFMYSCICIYLYIYIFVHVYMCTYIHTYVFPPPPSYTLTCVLWPQTVNKEHRVCWNSRGKVYPQSELPPCTSAPDSGFGRWGDFTPKVGEPPSPTWILRLLLTTTGSVYVWV